MKKNIFFIVATALCASLLFGCKGDTTTDNPTTEEPYTTNLSGEEIAKLLLASERLDSTVLSKGSNILEAREAFNYIGSNDFINCLILPKIYLQGTCNVSGNTYEWSEFTDYCNIESFFSSYETNISSTVENACSLIDIIKENANITDKWIKYNHEDTTQYMLMVDGVSETLIESSDVSYRICKRYTDSAARNVYEICQYDYETANSYYFSYIPGDSYEFVSKLNGRTDICVIGDNTDGLWNLFYTVDTGDHCNASYVMSGSDVSYIFNFMIFDNKDNYAELAIASGGLTSDILRIYDNEVSIYPNAFSGIKCLRLITDKVTTSHDDSSADILEINGTYSTVNASPSIVLSNGTVIEPFNYENLTAEEADAIYESVHFRNGVISAGADGYTTTLSFYVPGSSLTERLHNLKAYLTSVGITCNYNFDTIISKAGTGSALLNQFLNSYKLNGMSISNYSNTVAAMNSYNTKFDANAALLNNVKDYDVVLINKEEFLAENYDFSSISDISSANTDFADDTLSVDSLSLTLDNLYLIDEGSSYTIKLAFAAKPENGIYDSCQMAILASDNEVYTTYESGDTFTLSQNATYSMDLELTFGEYDIVGYIATSNDIRVSEFFKLTSSVTAGTTYEYDNMLITVNEDGSLTAAWIFNYNITTEISTAGISYTYNDIYDSFLCYIANYGTASGVVEQLNADGTWSEYSLGDTPTDCTLRMAYTYDDNGSEATAYYTLVLVSEQIAV